ncbi:MAG: anhydro-N-acetylmuramic acid kinase [Candidatus Methanosuratincola sp.]|jgi:anhydro-N-acetylmuramic acid kinase
MLGLRAVLEKEERLIVGLMSGTSMDGIDAALVRTLGSGTETRVELLEFATIPYDASVKDGLESLTSGGSTAELSRMNFAVGSAFAEAALFVIRKAGLKPTRIDLIASHGQTVYHSPPSSGCRLPSTLQIGELDVIAKTTGIITVGDFRPSDMAVGGEGAPIVPIVDYILYRKPQTVRLAQNIGGMANVTVVTEHIGDVIAFDTGPGNILMDLCVKIHTGGRESLDREARYASSGSIAGWLLSELVSHPYLSKSPPKTTGRELFGVEMAKGLYERSRSRGLSFQDLIRTLLEFTVESIVSSYERFVFPRYVGVDEVIVSGGGVSNPLLFERLRERLSPLRVATSDSYGIPHYAKEAVAMAVLGNELVSGGRTNLPSATGAKRCVPMGKITLGGGY